MTDKRKTAEEIIPEMIKHLTDQPQSLNQLMQATKEQEEFISHESLEKYLKLIIQIQTLLQDKTIHYQEQTIAGRTYKTAWLSKK
ncbi:MAG: hypothetical protein ACTSQE_16130 [Candidatus Heimdallarchaeaceae archaeon]